MLTNQERVKNRYESGMYCLIAYYPVDRFRKISREINIEIKLTPCDND